EFGLAGHRADDHSFAGAVDGLELADRRQVDEVRWSGQPEFHHGDAALVSGEKPTVVAKLAKQRGRLANRLWSMIGERCWDHVAPPTIRTTCRRLGFVAL